MLCREIIEMIEKDYPLNYALEWDNSGFLAGWDHKEVRRIYIALDATDDIVERAVCAGADMLVTHHPLIFSGQKSINNRSVLGRRLLRLIQADIACYSMHTNYDVCKMAQLSGEKMGFSGAQVLEVTWEGFDGETPMGIGQVADLEEPVTLDECCRKVKEAFGLEHVKVFGEMGKTVQRIAVCPGSGKSVIDEAVRKQADVLVTGDIGHHEGIDAWDAGLAIIDAGHYGVEHIFISDMGDYLRQRLKEVEIICAPVIHPFKIV